MSKVQHLISKTKKHATLGVLFGLLVATIFIAERAPQAVAPTSLDVPGPSDETATAFISAKEGVEPLLLTIPKLGLTAPFGDTLGLYADGEVEVPDSYEEVGWYRYSPIPGTLGPAIVLGHVDSVDGPAIFYSLGQLSPGDEIVVERSDGQDVVFEVTKSERYEQNSFPTELVYGNLDHAGIRLITCSGWYDKETQRYSHNRVVFAKLKS